MFRWGNRKKKQELAAARARVEGAQRTLEPHVSSASLQDAKRALTEARAAEERGDEDARGAYEEAWKRTCAVRAELVLREPLGGALQLLGQAEELLEMLEDPEVAQGWLEVLTARVEAGDVLGVERLLARRGELAPQATLSLVALLYRAERVLGVAPWLTQARALVVASLREAADDELEDRLLLLELCALQAHAGDLQGTRETLAPLDEDARDQALLLLAEAELAAGDLARGEATLESIQQRATRSQGALLRTQALVRVGEAYKAAVLARELPEPERSEALLQVLAARAAAGSHEETRALLSELDPSRAESARFVLFEEALARGDAGSAQELEQELEQDETRSLAWGRLAEAFAARRDLQAALSAAERIEFPLLRAETLELIGWSSADSTVAREAFQKGLELAAERAREGAGMRGQGQLIEPRWIELASRLQTALGDWESALVNATSTPGAEQRGRGLSLIAHTCGRVRVLEGIDGLCARLPAPADRLRVLCAAAGGLLLKQAFHSA